MNETESRGRAWLIKTYGYDERDIVYQARRSPDFLTRDGKGWEIKKVRNGTVVFYPAQIVSLKSHPSVIVLIFNGGTEPEAIIPFSDLTIPGYKDGYRLVVATRDPDFTLFFMNFPPDLMESLKRIAKQHNRSVTAEIIHILIRSLRADERRATDRSPDQ